ncbi:protein asteroid-like [Osmia bicornis bicornis]|uniref:protein asteroid-like n=1 Tax=Osmia bicornis bicornis TaxID=1437191 RepID=UPI0010F98FDE|nr:protein asteroid-like [Osmia bicornis bicornis]
MGIKGLTKFISNRSDHYLEYYELHDTYLVIDGNSICCQLYISYANCNCVFGGDYDKYAQCVSDFFDNLLKCNITPLVLFDGAYENKKMKTIISRTRQWIHTASSFCPLSQRRIKFFPLFLWKVFKNVLKEKNIRYMQCLFEADNAIASVAKILNCPVLSYDSDFYIYGSLYIPFNTFDNYATKSGIGKGYVICCKIYRTERLLNSFKGLDESMLPLAAILLGNDYVNRCTFRNFFCHLKLHGVSRSTHNIQQRRIEKTFIWLSKYTLDKAVAGILSTLDKPIRQRVLHLIETNINSYTNASTEILTPLGFSKDYVAQVNSHHLNRIFKYDGDIDSLTYIEEIGEKDGIDTSEEEEEEIEIMNESESMSSNALVSNLPVWFINEFLMAEQEPYLLDIIIRGLYICPVQIEDYNYSSSIMICSRIINVIFALLKSAVNDEVRHMSYMTRDENGGNLMTHFVLECTGSIVSCALPSLANLREVPLTIRRKILNDTLEVADMKHINEFPSEWILYIMCIKYWMKHLDPSRLFNSCTYSLYVCMLFHIIDIKIGKYRDLHDFQCKYSKRLQAIEEKRKANGYKPNYSMNVSITKALNGVNPDDCILATPFFISHFKMDTKLYSNPKKFNKFIVHKFAEFQNCLKFGMNLNTLLGEPYPPTNIANLYNGTLLYNLSTNFQGRDDIERYINTVFHKSPSLLRVFNIFLVKIKQEAKSHRKHRKHRKHKQSKMKSKLG